MWLYFNIILFLLCLFVVFIELQVRDGLRWPGCPGSRGCHRLLSIWVCCRNQTAIQARLANGTLNVFMFWPELSLLADGAGGNIEQYVNIFQWFASTYSTENSNTFIIIQLPFAFLCSSQGELAMILTCCHEYSFIFYLCNNMQSIFLWHLFSKAAIRLSGSPINVELSHPLSSIDKWFVEVAFHLFQSLCLSVCLPHCLLWLNGGR